MAKPSTPLPPNAPRSKQGANAKARKKGGKRRKETVWIKIGRKLFGRKAEEVSDKYVVSNPLYYIDEEGRERKRPLPEGLTDREKKILQKVRKNAYKLDYKCFGCCGCSCCGLTLGRTTIIGIVPAAGPIIDVTLGVCMVNLKARKLDLPWRISAMMYVRHAISEGIGLVPVFGDFWIAWYKVNSRNSFAIEVFLEQRADKRVAEEGNY